MREGGAKEGEAVGEVEGQWEWVGEREGEGDTLKECDVVEVAERVKMGVAEVVVKGDTLERGLPLDIAVELITPVPVALSLKLTVDKEEGEELGVE